MLAPRSNVIKLLFTTFTNFRDKLEFVLGKAFQLSPIIVGKATRVNIRLGWGELQGQTL
jgi:hypothetical protein